MYPLWDIAIAPVIRAAGPRRIVEIGALRGETTVLMLDSLGSDVELHVIDPVPEFDPAEHEQRWPGRYHFHRDLSVNVLPELPPVDVALIDGDHNWYTVYHELSMLRDSARKGGAPLPVMIMHDVLWPYGRRDLYYGPDQIPEEFRQPYDTRGMALGKSDLLPARAGGVNPTMANALHEGGPRNGVMTALDDFLAEHDKPVRKVLVPIYFGLQIVVEEERLAAEPALAKALDELESPEVRYELLELAEELRLKVVEVQHRLFFRVRQRIPVLSAKYLNTLKASLLNEHYVENEVRMAHLFESAKNGRAPDTAKLQDPFRNLRNEYATVESQHRTGGRRPKGPSGTWAPYAPMGRVRLDHLEACLDRLRTDRVGGDLVSCGTTRGGDAIFMAGYLDAHDMQRKVWVADRFLGPVRAGTTDGDADQSGDLNAIRTAFDRFDLLDDRVRFLQGPLADTLADAPIKKVSLLRVEADDHESTTTALEALYDKVALQGFVVIDNHRNPECRRAVEEFRARRGISDALERVDWEGAVWRKTVEAPATEKVIEPPASPSRPPLAPPAPADAVDLTIVVVFYNMRREAERTLHSLTRAYQQGIEDLSYEVLVMENGSAEDQKLGDDFVRSFGPEFRYVDLGAEATPSPVHALNRGMALSRGNAVCFMIDGAHVLTPGVLRYGIQGLRSHEPAMVVAQQWYVGPGQQPEAGAKGYDQTYEDRLFDRIHWPEDGYRLFRIGHFVGERDWFDGLWESNCVFVPRAALEQVGGMDEAFSVAGGGYANLDFYERMGSQAGLSVVSILGEGSFHQVHGGTTTNEFDVEERNRRLVSYREHFGELRGRYFSGHGKPIHYVGSFSEHSRRTRARRSISQAFWKESGQFGPDGFPAEPIPMTDEVRLAFTEAFWNSLDWQDTTWLGHRVEKCPTDLLAYQDLVVRLRPDWIVETGTGSGGRAIFLASICELVGHGQVLSVGADEGAELPTHTRLQYLPGDPLAAETVAAVAEHVGAHPNALVVLGRDSRERLIQAFDGYASLVPTGSYVVFEDTIVNAHPVWPSHGPGPSEAVKMVMKVRTDFGVDPHLEKHGLTFNSGGYLKRLSGGPEPAAAGGQPAKRRGRLRGGRKG